jgi:hypothetical protein
MAPARVWGLGAVSILVMAVLPATEGPDRPSGPPGTRHGSPQAADSPARWTIAASPSRFRQAPPPAPAHAEAALSITPLNPEIGFLVDRATLEWLPVGLGLRAGDAVLQINGESLVSTAQLLEAVRGASEGSSVELRVRRATTGEVEAYWAAP